MKKGFSAFALAASVGLAACGTDDEPVIVEEQPVIEQPAQPPPGPAETDRMLTDTMMGPDSAGEVIDTTLSPPPE